MKNRLIATTASLALTLTVALTGCTGSGQPDGESETNAAPGATHAVETPSPAAPVSDIDAGVQVFVTALDDLGITHTDPVRAEVGLSGAKAAFDITINGFDAGINVFPDADAMATWGKASDSLGGIYVASGNVALSLNSREGVADSAEIAPKIAEAVGGEAHGV